MNITHEQALKLLGMVQKSICKVKRCSHCLKAKKLIQEIEEGSWETAASQK